MSIAGPPPPDWTPMAQMATFRYMEGMGIPVQDYNGDGWLTPADIEKYKEIQRNTPDPANNPPNNPPNEARTPPPILPSVPWSDAQWDVGDIADGLDARWARMLADEPDQSDNDRQVGESTDGTSGDQNNGQPPRRRGM